MPATTIPSTYRAYQYHQYGPLDKSLKLNDNVKHQQLAASQARLRIKAASVNPADYILVEQGDKFLSAVPPPTAESPFGFGFDVAGTIVEVGSDVKDFKVGDDVFAMTPWNGFGTVTEYMTIDTSVLARKPTNVSFEQAGGAPLAALTSYQALFQHGKLEAGQTVLILGGSSSTGGFAIQLAKSVGATVITTASAANTEFVKSLGADQVIDYKSQKWADILEQHSVDVLYDCGVEADAWNTGAQKVLKANTGRYVTLWPEPEPVREAEFGAINVGHVVVQPSGEQLEKVAALMGSGKVKTPVDSVVEFEELSSAIARVQSRRARGKVVVRIASE